MSIENLDRMFHPRAVAVVGASEKNGAIGNAVFRNLLSAGYKGTLFPVNPNHDRIMGIPSYPRLEAIGQKVDLVIAATPIDLAPEIVRESGKIEAGGVVIIAGGGKEREKRGARLKPRSGRPQRIPACG